MTFDSYIGKKLIGSSDDIDEDLYEDIDDDGDAISITFGTMDYDEDDKDNDWIVETGCIIYGSDDHRIKKIEPTAKVVTVGDSGLGKLDPDDWVDEEKIKKILSKLVGTEAAMPESWPCSCYVVYENGEYTDDVDMDVPCTTDEYSLLLKLEYLQQILDFDPENEEMIDSVVEHSNGLFADSDEVLKYYDKHVDDCPELFDFVDRVTDAGYAIFEDECEDTEDREAGTLSWNYRSVL